MFDKTNFINTIILFLYLLLLIVVLILVNYSVDNSQNSEVDLFYEQISKYKSFNEDKYSDYYNKYQENNNLILSLNTVNYPNYYDINTTSLSPILPLTLVNRKYYLTNNFIPNNLIKITNVNRIIRKNETMLLEEKTFNAYIQLYNKSKDLGLNIYIFSAYRPYDKQISIYNNSINKSYVAMPGHSEHQTGEVIDISTLDTGLTKHFEYTNEFNFLQSNAHLYGFILRYPKGKEHITGYSYEPWHYRYVGIEHAKIIHDNNLTLEEYIYNYIPI